MRLQTWIRLNALYVALVMLAGHQCRAQGVELLDNGGFETKLLSPWSDLGTGVSLTHDVADVHGGQAAVEIHNGSGVRATVSSLQAGKTYTLSLFAKAQKNNRLRADVTGGERPLAPTQIISGESYQSYSVDFSVQRAGDVTISIWKDDGTGSGLGYADDVSLTEKPLEHFGTAFPGNAPLINVKTLGAAGDGVHDDTAAMNAAIARCSTGFVFLPSGTYLVSSPLQWKTVDGKWKCGVGLCGESRESTRIKLRDGVFSKAAAPLPIIQTGSQEDWGEGQGNEAFDNFIEDLTIDAGSRNPGAIGIDFIGNNRAAIRNVAVCSGPDSGAAGIAMRRRYVGPCLLKNVSITGFDVGMDVSNQDYGITIEHLSLAKQRVVGIRNADNLSHPHFSAADSDNSTTAAKASPGLTSILSIMIKPIV